MTNIATEGGVKLDFKFNVNEYVKVKLNDLGISILKARHNELNGMIRARGGKGFGEFELKVDEEGYTKFPLWELMNIFGHAMVMGLDVPFETNIIVTKGKPISE